MKHWQEMKQGKYSIRYNSLIHIMLALNIFKYLSFFSFRNFGKDERSTSHFDLLFLTVHLTLYLYIKTEFPLITKGGARIEVLLNATTRRDEQGNVIGQSCQSANASCIVHLPIYLIFFLFY